MRLPRLVDDWITCIDRLYRVVLHELLLILFFHFIRINIQYCSFTVFLSDSVLFCFLFFFRPEFLELHAPSKEPTNTQLVAYHQVRRLHALECLLHGIGVLVEL